MLTVLCKCCSPCLALCVFVWLLPPHSRLIIDCSHSDLSLTLSPAPGYVVGLLELTLTKTLVYMVTISNEDAKLLSHFACPFTRQWRSLPFKMASNVELFKNALNPLSCGSAKTTFWKQIRWQWCCTTALSMNNFNLHCQVLLKVGHCLAESTI